MIRKLIHEGNKGFFFIDFDIEEDLVELPAEIHKASTVGVTEVVIIVHIDEVLFYDRAKSFIPKLTALLQEQVNNGIIQNFVTIRGFAEPEPIPEKNHLCFDWLLCSEYVKHKYMGYDKFVWDPHADKILFLAKKLFKFHRIFPFVMLYTSHKHLLKYTFQKESFMEMFDYTDQDSKTVDQVINLLTNGELSDVLEFVSTIDEKYLETENPNNYMLESSMVNVADLHDAFVEYSTETFSDYPKWCCEKTYRPICIGMPFFTAQPETKQYLESINFKTFDHLVPVEISNEVYPGVSTHIAPILNNARTTVDKCLQFKLEIEDEAVQQEVLSIIEHNKQNAGILLQKHVDMINSKLLEPLTERQVLVMFGNTIAGGRIKL